MSEPKEEMTMEELEAATAPTQPAAEEVSPVEAPKEEEKSLKEQKAVKAAPVKPMPAPNLVESQKQKSAAAVSVAPSSIFALDFKRMRQVGVTTPDGQSILIGMINKLTSGPDEKGYADFMRCLKTDMADYPYTPLSIASLNHPIHLVNRYTAIITTFRMVATGKSFNTNLFAQQVVTRNSEHLMTWLLSQVKQ